GLSTANLLEAGKGYCAFIRNGSTPTLVDLTGRLNQGDVTIPLGFTPHGAPGNGWNLVGNPYASAIDWDADDGQGDSQGWTKENVSSVISIRDNGGGGIFHYWDGDTNSSDLVNGHIASGQSFWLRATGSNPRLIAREGVKVSTAAQFYRKRMEQIPSFGLILSGDSLVDRVYFKVRKGATDALDQWDAVKLPNDVLNVSFIDRLGNSLAIDARGELPRLNESIEVLMLGLVPGSYQLKFEVNNALGNYRYVWLDHFLNTETILLPGKDLHISVSQDLASQNAHRFMIRMERMSPGIMNDTASFHPQITGQGTLLADSLFGANTANPMGNSPLPEIRLYPNPANTMLYIFCRQQTGDRIRIVNSVGEDLGEFPAHASPISSVERGVDIASLPSGIYFAIVRTKTKMSAMRFEKYAD
ncbi:MAG TPA: T9SS type A sorting domain-containing protein, partial [Chryseolinea sp.]|nr:T9SS type A sorting domain-containing protein [Chryseolinea sp.]